VKNECYMCHGRGTVKSVYNRYGVNFTASVKCPICNGTGNVDEVIEPWWQTLLALIGAIIISVSAIISCFKDRGCN